MQDIARARDMLEVAIEALETGGEASVRVRDIAAACGITTPILYRAFGSREGLIIDAQVERYIRTWTAIGNQFLPQIEAATTLEELQIVVDAMLAAVLTSERADVRRVRASVMGSALTRPALMAAIDAALAGVVDQVSASLEVARSRGLIRDGFDIRAAVWWYLGQMDGRLLVEQMNSGIDDDAWNQVARRAILAVFFDDLR